MTLWAGGVIWGDWAALKGVYQILVQNTLYPQPRKLMDNHQLSLICMWTCSQPLGARGGMIWGKYISNHASPGATTCNKSVFRKWPKYCKLTWKCQFVFADPLFFLHNIKTVLLTVHIWGRGGVNHLGSDTSDPYDWAGRPWAPCRNRTFINAVYGPWVFAVREIGSTDRGGTDRTANHLAQWRSKWCLTN